MRVEVEAMESWRPEIEDGLALFKHMRAREHRNYLNNCNDDIEEIKYEGGLSTFRISGSTPTRKGGGLLISDIEKSDYDWLLTPPGTPLFPSLDQETASITFTQRTTPTCSASASKSLKGPSLKSLSESPSPHQISAASSTRKTTCTYMSPSPQRTYAVSPARPSASSSRARSPSTYAVSPARPSASSSRARSPSTSPAPSLIRSRPTTGAFSPSRSITPTGRSPATASKLTSRSSTPTLCRNNTSPSAASRRGYLAHKGPRRSLSPSLVPWEPIMAVLSTEPLPNLRTSPSSKSLQRGKSGITTNKDFATRHDAQYANTSETSRVSTRSEDSKKGSSPARRRSQPTTCTNEMISSFSNRKLMERQAPPGRNLQNMFRPLMLSAPSTSIYRTGPELSNYNIPSPSVVPSMFINESPIQNMRVSATRDCSHDSEGQGKDLQNNWSIVIDPEKLEGIVNNENDLSCKSHNCVLLEEATKEPTKSEAKPGEETCLTGAWEKNQPCVLEDSKDDSACKDIRIAGAHETSDTDLGVRDLDPLKKGVSQKHRKHTLLAHSFSGENQMQNVRFSREKLSREDNKMFASNKFQSSLRYKLNKDDVEPAFETHAFENCTRAGSQDGAHLTNFHPVRRQLCMKSADMVYDMWNTKKAGSFDISTSDSYSCSESLDSSYVDNHTEKFSEDMSEVDSMSHTGYSLSTSSMTNHSFYNLTCAEKPLTEIPTELGTGEDRFMYCTSLNSVSGVLEAIEPAVECCEKGQSIQSRKQLKTSMTMDLSQLWTPSADSQYQVMTEGNDALSVKDVLSFMDARNMKSDTKQSTAGKVHSNLDVKGELGASALKLVAEDGDGGEAHALKSSSAGAVMEDTTGWDDDSKKVQPWASPLKRNVTVEEATDTVLFCRSIIHEIVYESATLGEEKCNSRIEEPSRVCSRIFGPSPLWRTSKSWSRKREPACNRAQQPIDHALQPRTKHVLTSNKGVPQSAHAAGKTHHKSKKKALCGFGFCRVM